MSFREGRITNTGSRPDYVLNVDELIDYEYVLLLRLVRQINEIVQNFQKYFNNECSTVRQSSTRSDHNQFRV